MAFDLDQRAIDDLARSGLTTADLRVEAVPNPFGESAGYLIPYYTPTGERHPKMFRQKLYERRSDGAKYNQPTKEELHPDPTPPYFAPPHICDYSARAERKLIVEGEKKAVAAIKYLGVQAVGIGGCANWHGLRSDDDRETHRPKTLNPTLKAWLAQGGTRVVEIAFDGDMMTNPNVAVAGSGLYWALKAEGYEPRFIVFPDGLGLDDWVMTQPSGDAAAAFEKLPRIEGWKLPVTAAPEMFRFLGIQTTNKGLIHQDERTLMQIINRHPRYMGRLWVDVVKKRTMDGDKPFDDGLTLTWLTEFQEFTPMLKWGMLSQAMMRVASANRRNTVKEWLEPLKWDGTPRLSRLLPDYFGTPDDAYTREIGVNFMVGAVARMWVPGTKFDNMLVLQGKQGIGKTRALIGLFGKDMACIAPHTTAIGSRDWLDAGGNGWCLILDELAGLTRMEHTELKTALSTESDTYRRAYRRDPETFPRQFVCAATTNESNFLTDPTGNRRYWSVPCGDRVLVDKLCADREQLWAEAVALYRDSRPFWSLSEEAKSAMDSYHQEFFQHDEFEEPVGDVLARARAESPACRPPVITLLADEKQPAGDHYFVGSAELMFAVAQVPHGTRASGLARRLSNCVARAYPEWRAARVYDGNGVRRRGFVRLVKEADAAPRATFETTWEAAFGNGSKF